MPFQSSFTLACCCLHKAQFIWLSDSSMCSSVYTSSQRFLLFFTVSLQLFLCVLVDPNTHNNKLATYHSWFAIPFSRNERMPINVPWYLHLDLSKHVMRNISRFRLRAHTLKVEAAAWLEDGSRVCDKCPGEDAWTCSELHALLVCQDQRICELRKHFSFLFKPYFEDLSAAQPFLLQQVNNQLVHNFLS